jgi:electron transport complex protein RnfD
MGGSIGEISALAILVGGIFLLWRKIITWHIPVSFILTSFIFSGILWLVNPVRFADPVFHILTGGLMLGAVFMATDMVTSPMTRKGMLLFGFGCGMMTILIRSFGAYPEGVSFAILIMNAFVPLINKGFKPKRFGKEVQHG